MIRGAAELNKMLGFYAPKTSNKDNYRAEEEGNQKPYHLMTDEELISLLKD
jgi:hypothetical protein